MGRRADQDYTLTKAEVLVNWYRSKATKHVSERFPNAEQTIAAVNSFLAE